MQTSSLTQRIDAAQGRIPCDLILKNATYLDVFSCQWKTGDLSIYQGILVGVEPGLKSSRVFDASGKWVVPGFVDAHVHVESSLMTPRYFEDTVLSRGTTTAICDPHELANVMGVPGLQYFLDSALLLKMDLWVMMSSCVPATSFETNGGGEIHANALVECSKHPRALGLGEMMNVPGVINKDPEVMKKIESFSGLPLDGHCPLLRGQSLSTYAVAGISSCHETSELAEATEKLSKGISVWIREGSVAKDLKTIAPLLSMATSTSMGFCTDDRNPLDIANEGHVDHLVRGAIQIGVPAEVAYRTASWSVARHYGINTGPRRIGAIAPGYRADLVVLEDYLGCHVHSVLNKGRWTNESDLSPAVDLKFENSIRAEIPERADLEVPEGKVHTIGIVPGKIITEHRIARSTDRGMAKLSVLERYGKGSKPANGYVQGFGDDFDGAIGSSVGHDSHNLIAVGSNSDDMRTAFAALAEMGGGFCVVKKGNIIGRLPLPFGGLMSEKVPGDLKSDLEKLRSASKEVGCSLKEPFLQLSFLSLPVIPALKLTDQGLFDFNQFRIIDVRAT